MQRKRDRASITLLLLSFIVGSVSLYLLIDDSWYTRRSVDKSKSIGVVTFKRGKVRHRGRSDLRWYKAVDGQNISSEDSIFVSEDAEASVDLETGKILIEEQSLVVFKNLGDRAELQLIQGSIVGKAKANRKLFINTGNGKTITLSAKQNSNFVIKKQGGKILLQIEKGMSEVEVDGVKGSLGANEVLSLDESGEVFTEEVSQKTNLLADAQTEFEKLDNSEQATPAPAVAKVLDEPTDTKVVFLPELYEKKANIVTPQATPLVAAKAKLSSEPAPVPVEPKAATKPGPLPQEKPISALKKPKPTKQDWVLNNPFFKDNEFEVFESEALDRQLASVNSTRTTVKTDYTWLKEHIRSFWLWYGSGYNTVIYDQSIPNRGTLNYTDLRGPSHFLEAGYINPNGFGGMVTYKQTPGQTQIDNADIDSRDYIWKTLSIEALFQKVSMYSFRGMPVDVSVRAGFQNHQVPFVHLNAATDLNLRENEINTVSMGLDAKLIRGPWSYEWYMRYQFPIATKALDGETFEINPVFAFDGSVGVSYKTKDRFRMGVYWYGQWHQYDFIYTETFLTNSGFQSLFYSNIDFRIGYDF